MNDDGEYETYTIKSYRQEINVGAHVTRDGIYVSASTFIFDCMIISAGMKRVVRLYYDPRIDSKWKIAI